LNSSARKSKEILLDKSNKKVRKKDNINSLVSIDYIEIVGKA